MFRKAALAVMTVIGMICFSVPAMAATKDIDKTMYVTADVLNVREIPSLDGEVIGGIYYGDSVKVIGQEEKTGEEPGWFRIAFDDEKEGFVSAEFLAETVPPAIEPAVYESAPVPANSAVYMAPAAAPAANVTTSTSASGAPIIKTSYVYAQSGTLVKIQKDANGNWTYGDGSKLTWVTDNEAMTEGGEAFTSYDPSTIDDLAGYLQTVTE